MREDFRERNTGWARRNSRIRFHESCKDGPKGKPHLTANGKGYDQNYSDAGSGGRWETQRKNWREANDFSTFYFTRFPDDMNEKDLWYVFKRWGDVREVFIPKYRNSLGRRYGFVRFKGVDDVGRLERQLDNQFVGGIKMHVNLPKHDRERRAKPNMYVQQGRTTSELNSNAAEKGKAKVNDGPAVVEDANPQVPGYQQNRPISYAQAAM